MSKKREKTRTRKKSNLFFFKVVDKEGKIIQTGSSKDYTSVLVEAIDSAKECGGYWQIMSSLGRVIEDNIPSKMEVR